MVPGVVLGEMDGPVDVCFCWLVDCSSICRLSVGAECRKIAKKFWTEGGSRVGRKSWARGK